MKQYRVVYRAPGNEKWIDDGDDTQIFTYRGSAETSVRMMNKHYEQYPGDYFEQKIQEREVSEWRDS